MAETKWNKDYQFTRRILITNAALASLVRSFGAVNVGYWHGRIELRGQTVMIDSQLDIDALNPEVLQQAVSVSMWLRGSDFECGLYFRRYVSKESGSNSSYFSISSTDEHKIFVIKAILDQFEEAFKTTDFLEAGEFVSAIEEDTLNYKFAEVRRKLLTEGSDGATPSYVEKLTAPEAKKSAEDQREVDQPAPRFIIGQKAREVPSKLPACKLYLDDLEEIATIFFLALEGEGKVVDKEPVVTYEVNGTSYSGLDKLLKIGGTIHSLSLRVNSKYSNALHFEGFHQSYLSMAGLSVNTQWVVYGKIKLICDSREFRYRRLFSELPSWVSGALSTAFPLCLILSNYQSFVNPGKLDLFLLVVAALFFLTVARRNTIVLKPSYEISRLGSVRFRSVIMVALSTVAGALLSVIFQEAWNKLK